MTPQQEKKLKAFFIAVLNATPFEDPEEIFKNNFYYNELKRIVEELLSLYSQDLKRKIEEIKITKKKMKSDDDLIVKRFVNGGKDLKDPAVARSRSNASNKSNGYNQALDDVLALIEGK